MWSDSVNFLWTLKITEEKEVEAYNSENTEQLLHVAQAIEKKQGKSLRSAKGVVSSNDCEDIRI